MSLYNKVKVEDDSGKRIYLKKGTDVVGVEISKTDTVWDKAPFEWQVVLDIAGGKSYVLWFEKDTTAEKTVEELLKLLGKE